jgi:TfuA protein
MMTGAVHVFVGPSAPDRALLSGLCLHPPVTRGDLVQLADEAPRLVMIIDGEFGQSLAVAVPEIRALLAAGVCVWGAASMGALRAAECWPLGMRGWGWVYGRYRAGLTSSDEDVALVFNPLSRRALTIPMVNIDWLCLLAMARKVLDHDAARLIRTLAASVPWRERDETALLQAARESGQRQVLEQLWRFAAAVPPGIRDRKRRDAELMLRAARSMPDGRGRHR